MKPYVRWIILAAGLLAAVGLFILVRPTDEPDRAGSEATASATPSPSATGGTNESPAEESEEPLPSPSPTSGATVIRVSVRAGRVEGPSQPEVQQGEGVRIVVEADVADEVHLHGYDLTAGVAPGELGEIEFRATATGVFEIELEESGLVLLQLRVVP